MLFMLIVGSLELVEQKFLFAEAKKMFQVVALQVGLEMSSKDNSIRLPPITINQSGL